MRRGDRLLAHVLVDERERQPFRQDFGQQGPAHSGLDPLDALLPLAILIEHDLAQPHLAARLQVHLAALISAVSLGDIGEAHALPARSLALAGHVIEPQHHVLGRHDDGLTARGRQNIVGRHHERARFELCFQRQWHVHRHLVAVEVGVERRAYQRMELNRLALDEHRLERLDPQAVQRRRAVQEHRVLANHLFENIPDLGALALHHLLGCFDGRGETSSLQLAEDERLEQLQRHLLGQAALVQLQCGADHDHRAA